MNSRTLGIITIVVGILVAVLIFGLFRPSGLGLDYDAQSFFEVRRLFFAAGVLAVLAFLLILSIAIYAGMSQAEPPNSAGKDIFESMIKVVPPIITLVLGYYFGQQSVPKSAVEKVNTPTTQSAKGPVETQKSRSSPTESKTDDTDRSSTSSQSPASPPTSQPSTPASAPSR